MGTTHLRRLEREPGGQASETRWAGKHRAEVGGWKCSIFTPTTTAAATMLNSKPKRTRRGTAVAMGKGVPFLHTLCCHCCCPWPLWPKLSAAAAVAACICENGTLPICHHLSYQPPPLPQSQASSAQSSTSVAEMVVECVKMGSLQLLPLHALSTHSPTWLSLRLATASCPRGELAVWNCPAASWQR